MRKQKHFGVKWKRNIIRKKQAGGRFFFFHHYCRYCSLPLMKITRNENSFSLFPRCDNRSSDPTSYPLMSVRELFFSCLILLNPLTASVPHHIETSQLICIANQLTGFYFMGNIGREWVDSDTNRSKFLAEIFLSLLTERCKIWFF